jgi:flap endonuclease-1
MARRGDVWAAASKDYDTLLFGAPRLLRFLTISGREFLPSTGQFRRLVPEVIDLEAQLASWGITLESAIDLALLVGTDFNDGVRGIGPKKALALVRKHTRIESMPDEIREAMGDVDALRRIYLSPAVTDEYTIQFSEPDREGIVSFLCEERQFSRQRVMDALARAFRG